MSELADGAKVLVVGPNWLGDLVMAEPVVRLLGEARPDLELHVLAPGPLCGVFQNHPQVEATVDTSAEHTGLFGRMRLWGVIRQGHYDAALVLRNSFGAAFDVSRAGVPVRIGFRRFPRSFFLTGGPPFPTGFRETHRTRSMLSLIEALGVDLPEWDSEDTYPRVFPGEGARARAEELLAEAGDGAALSEGPLVLLHPGARYGPAKMWGERKFAQLADRLIEEKQATVGFLGTADEEGLVADIMGDMDAAALRPGAARSLAGRTRDMADLIAVLARADLVLGNDSGICHLASAAGTPVVAIFGSTSSDFSGPRGLAVNNIWERLDCSPCFKRECPREDYMACMDAIPAARAYGAVNELLGLKEPEFEEIQAVPGDAPSAPESEV